MSTPVLDFRSGLFVLLRRFAPERLIALDHRMMSTLEGEDFEEYVESIMTNSDRRQQELEIILSLLPVSARIHGTLNDQYWFRQLPLADYETIECPVLILHGEFDVIPITHAEFVAEQVGRAELHRVDADHLLMIGPDADESTRTVRTFIDRVVKSTEQPTQ
jgi:pimeloyl-ACP methyl ester carboxylesterase